LKRTDVQRRDSRTVKIFCVTRQRLRRIVVLVVGFAAAAVLITKAAIDWRLRQLDEAARPSAAKLGELLDQASATQAQTDQPRQYPLPDDLIRALSNPSQFRLYRKVTNVPEAVRSAFAKAADEETFSMADPGGRWEATDVIRDASLPRRRLASVAIGSGLCLLFYEHGGIGKNDNVAVFRMADGRAEATWHAYIPHAVVNPTDLAKALQEKSYREAPFF
jgi:hypothetical protein